MVLSNYEVIEVSTIVITGLLILLTFQALVPFVFENQFNDIIADLRELTIERIKIENIARIDSSCDVIYYDNNHNDDSDFIVQANKEYSEKIKTQYYNLDRNDDSYCNQLKIKLFDVNNNRDAIEGWVDNLYLSPEFDLFHSVVSVHLVAGAFFINLINIAMIFPFAVASIVALYSKVEINNLKSIMANRILLLGFVILICGLILIIFLLGCGTFPGMCPIDNYPLPR